MLSRTIRENAVRRVRGATGYQTVLATKSQPGEDLRQNLLLERGQHGDLRGGRGYGGPRQQPAERRRQRRHEPGVDYHEPADGRAHAGSSMGQRKCIYPSYPDLVPVETKRQDRLPVEE